MKTKIKICGLTKQIEASYVNENLVDFAGMVLFYEKSKRNIDLNRASQIIGELDPAVRAVAVTVAPSLDEIKRICQTGFSMIQIHGRIPPGIETVDVDILKAFNVSDIQDFAWVSCLPQVKGYVFDAARPGSGQTFDWGLLDQIPRDDKLLLLAGGLTSENVAEAIAYLHPDGVDVSSSVEDTIPFGKNKEKIDAFCRAVRLS